MTPEDIELHAFEPGRRCPKCGYDAITTHYWRGSHEMCPTYSVGTSLHRMFGLGMPGYYGKDPELRAASEERERKWRETYRSLAEAAARVPEHHDRECVRCGYRWSEKVVEQVPA